MKDFNSFLKTTGEVGYVDEISHSIVYASGLPGVRLHELVIFENNELGQVLSLNHQYAEILLFSKEKLNVGERVTRTGRHLEFPMGPELLGKTVDPLGRVLTGEPKTFKPAEYRALDTIPSGITTRTAVTQPLHTGVSMVDLIVPLGMGQRELVIGDRKTGKSVFLMQSVTSQAKLGNICIYCAIGKKTIDIRKVEEHFKAKAILPNTIIVAANALDTTGISYLAPYAAMSIAEYFRDQGRNVLVIMDDLTTHAKTYREISLLAKRFPGRSAYPGDIFYTHSRLLERAGNFLFKGKTPVSITCMPVAESILGDLSGYIQTNVMAITDGHIYFDSDLFDQGRRPAVSPFLSVTRVGKQTQTPLLRDINGELSSFLIKLESLREFLHFGAELSESVKRTLELGDRLINFFSQDPDSVVPINVNILIITLLWVGAWKGVENDNMKAEMEGLIAKYYQDANFRKLLDDLVASANKFADIMENVKNNQSQFITRKV